MGLFESCECGAKVKRDDQRKLVLNQRAERLREQLRRQTCHARERAERRDVYCQRSSDFGPFELDAGGQAARTTGGERQHEIGRELLGRYPHTTERRERSELAEGADCLVAEPHTQCAVSSRAAIHVDAANRAVEATVGDSKAVARRLLLCRHRCLHPVHAHAPARDLLEAHAHGGRHLLPRLDLQGDLVCGEVGAVEEPGEGAHRQELAPTHKSGKRPARSNLQGKRRSSSKEVRAQAYVI